jgi:DNA polymerase IV
VVEVPPGHELEFLHPLPVERLWGVGPVTLEKLSRARHRHRRRPRGARRARWCGLGGPTSAQLATLAQGIDDRPVEPHRDPKSIGHEETFPHDLHTVAELDRELVRFADAVASRLRRRRGCSNAHAEGAVRRVQHHHPLDHRHRSGRHRTGDPGGASGRAGGGRSDTGRAAARDLGSNFAAPSRQLSLLEDEATGPSDDSVRRAAEAIDQIRDRFGTAAIGPGSSVGQRGLRVVRPGAQQWGPDDIPPAR